MRKAKMGRPRVDEKGYVYAFYAPREMQDNITKILECTGQSVSEFMRGAVAKHIYSIQRDQVEKLMEQYGIPQEAEANQ